MLTLTVNFWSNCRPGRFRRKTTKDKKDTKVF